MKRIVSLLIMVAVLWFVPHVTYADGAPAIAEARIVQNYLNKTEYPYQEFCLGGGQCGWANSTHPKSKMEKTVIVTGWNPGSTDDPTTYTRTTDVHTGPVYHDHSIAVTVCSSTPPSSGYLAEYSYAAGGAWQTSSIPFFSLPGEDMKGQLVAYSTNANEYYTKRSISINSSQVFRYRNTSTEWSYTYRIYVCAVACKATPESLYPILEEEKAIPPANLTVRNHPLTDNDDDLYGYFDVVIAPDSIGEIDVTPSVSGVACISYAGFADLLSTTYVGGGGGQD